MSVILSVIWSHREASRGRGAGSGLEFFGTKGSMTLSRAGFKVYPDLKMPPQNHIPQFVGQPVGGVRPIPNVKPVPWTEAIEEKVSNDLLAAHARNFLDCIKTRRQPIAPVEDGHRVATACHLANISLRLGRKIEWDAEREEIVGDTEAAAWLDRSYRKPWDSVLRSFHL